MFTSITQPSLIRTATKSIALVTPRRSFRPTIAWANRDPTHQSPPDKSVGGSEQLIDDTSGDDIAASEGAYDPERPRPDQSAHKIGQEKAINMNHSAASREPADSSQNRTQKLKGYPDLPPSSGGTE